MIVLLVLLILLSVLTFSTPLDAQTIDFKIVAEPIYTEPKTITMYDLRSVQTDTPIFDENRNLLGNLRRFTPCEITAYTTDGFYVANTETWDNVLIPDDVFDYSLPAGIYPNRRNEAQDTLEETINLYNLDTKEIYYDTYFCQSESGNIDNLREAETEWRKVPEHLRNLIVENGWSIVVSDISLKVKYGYSQSLAGITEFRENVIYLDDRRHAIYTSLFHEVGHVLDKIWNWPSNTDEFIKIFEAERYDLYEVDADSEYYGAVSPQEYWATVVHNILRTGDKYRDTAPESYEYVYRYLQGEEQ